MTHHITFHCRTISPMFIGGADPDMAELRPPSLKGALRFWERAIAGHWIFENGLNGKEDHIALLRHDEVLLGGAFATQEKSKVLVEINHGFLQTIDGEALQNKGVGLEYLLFTLVVHNKKKKGIKPGVSFQITFRSKDKNTEALQKAIAAFWALTYFGALGTRARRGAGAFGVENCEGYSLPEGISFSPDGDLAAFLRNGLQASQKIFGVPTTAAFPKGYSTIGKQIWVSKKGFSTWENALEEIGGLMFRLRQPRRPAPQYSNEEPRFTQETLHQKAAFGLPVSVRNEKDNIVNFSDSSNDSAIPSYDRRASPLWITLAGCSGKIHWILSKLEGDFMDKESSLSFKNLKGRVFSWPKQDDSVLQEFLKIVRNNANPVFNQ